MLDMAHPPAYSSFPSGEVCSKWGDVHNEWMGWFGVAGYERGGAE